MKAFVTGGTGFIGGRLIDRLLQRGDHVSALVRSPKDAEAMRQKGVEPVIGDIRDRETMRAGMTGADAVFHVAAWYKIGSPDWQSAEAINVEGTQNVLTLATELGVPRIIYTSTIAVYGNTHGHVVTESDVPPDGPFLTEYDRTKWKAHYKIAEPLIKQGAPVTVVMPGAVYGPGDKSDVAQMMDYFRKGYFPIFPAPDLTLCFAHVDDIIEGHLLAFEKGRPGQAYILAGPIYTMRQMIDIWADLTGRPRPLLYAPAVLLKPFAPVMAWLGQRINLPNLFSADSLRMLDATYIAYPEKAERELGWQARPVYEGMRETLAYQEETVPAPSPDVIRKRQTAGIALAAGLAVGFAWLFLNRKRS